MFLVSNAGIFCVQIVAAYTMIDALNKKGYNGYSIAAPSLSELQEIFAIAAPIFITIVSKVVTNYGSRVAQNFQI